MDKYNFKLYLNKIIDFVELLSKESFDGDCFTPHDYSHCDAVDKIVKALIEKSKINEILELSELENFILFASVWTHDLGMFDKVAEEYLGDDFSPENKRRDHDKISAKFLNKENGEFRSYFKELPDDIATNFIHTINIISKYHRRVYNINECPETRYFKGQKIRARLLSCLLRLGDTLHIDSSRYDRKMFNILQYGDFDRTARMHWLKSYVVSSVHLDIEKHTILVNIDLPEQENEKYYEWDESINRLKFIIHENIYEDILSTSSTMRFYKLPFYDTVDIQINLCPGYESDKIEDIRNTLNDLDILLSPNTSKVIKKSIESLRSLSTTTEFKSYKTFKKHTKQLLDHLVKILEKRPCHVGLKKIVERFNDIYCEFDKKSELTTKSDIRMLQDKIFELCTSISDIRNAERLKIINSPKDEIRKYSNIILFGFSETVSGYLNAIQDNEFKRNANLYIFECGGKRQFSYNNSLEYNDGVHYAVYMHKIGFKNINILPETSFASLIIDKDLNNNNSCVLFGANGIDISDNSCGHTSGHLSIAIMAKYFNIPVYVISEQFKYGIITWNKSLERDNSLWITGHKEIINELNNKNINLINYREDKISNELIFKIITNADA